MPRIALILTILSLLFISGCQEVSIYIEYPGDDAQEKTISMENTTSTPGFVPTRTFSPTLQALSQENYEAKIDIDHYFFPVDMLPEDIELHYDGIKQYNVSYLENPGSLFGIAYVRSYYSNEDDLYVFQSIIQSPLPGQIEMLNAGHNQRNLSRDLEKTSLGDYAMTGHSNNDENFYEYRFYKGNIIVIVTLSGNHSFVSQDNAYQLAKTIEEKLPDEFPTTERIITPSLDLRQDIADEYIRQLDLIECESEDVLTENIPYTNQGICFKSDVIKLISNLKTGLYDEKYGEIIYLKEFIFAPQFGERSYEFLGGEWGFAWGELHAGDYQALFWVNDQLVKSIPFNLISNWD